MQDPKHNSHSRKRWYQRAMDVATRWKTINPKPSEIPRAATNITMWKSSTISRSSSSSSSDLTNATVNNNNNNNVNSRQKMRRCTSLKLASSFTRVCLCAPIASSYTDVFQMEYVPPRRSYSYPRSKPPNYNNHNNNNIPIAQQQQQRAERRTMMMISSARMSTSGSEGRRIFRGKSLTDDVLMRRFVVEEEAAMMQVRRRNEMDIIRRRASLIKRKRLGPSPLSRMVLAEELDEEIHEY